MAEPLTLERAKAHLRVVDDQEDDLIAGLIVAAREWVEQYTGLALVVQPVVEVRRSGFAGAMELRRWPVAGDVTIAIGYSDASGEAQTLAGYRLQALARPAAVLPAAGELWPAQARDDLRVTIAYTAGFPSEADVPQALKQAMLILVGYWYGDREAGGEPPAAVYALARHYRLPVIG